MNPLDLTTLQLFCDIVETGSVSRTAERNFISQPAASQRLQALEREYKQQLLNRGHGKDPVTPTEAGKVLYGRALALLNDARELDAVLRGNADGISGIVRVAAVYSLGLHMLPGRFKKFIEKHPDARPHIQYCHTEEVLRHVQDGDADVGVVAIAGDVPGIKQYAFASEEMILICSANHPMAAMQEVSLGDLHNQLFVAFGPSSPTRSLIDRHLNSAGVTVRLAGEYDNVETIKSVVEVSGAVSIVPDGLAPNYLADGSIVVVRLSETDRFVRESALIVRSDKTQPAIVQAFIRGVRGKPEQRTTLPVLPQ